jgi:hypothetical protein
MKRAVARLKEGEGEGEGEAERESWREWSMLLHDTIELITELSTTQLGAPLLLD